MITRECTEYIYTMDDGTVATSGVACYDDPTTFFMFVGVFFVGLLVGWILACCCFPSKDTD